MTNIGEALVKVLENRDVEVVFGIPGVHTVELYRGLADSNIRHVTARHEQGCGFMADGYARASGKPGVAFVITGPGLTNIITPMAQARADSVPMLVISGVNRTDTLGKGLGHLHELPDQLGMVEKVALNSSQIRSDDDLVNAMDKAFEGFAMRRGGPVHIEVPTDVMPLPYETAIAPEIPSYTPNVVEGDFAAIAKLLANSSSPVILAGGGAKSSDAMLSQLAENVDAPVILTTNARGLMHKHPLCVPASPSLAAVRQLLSDADVVLALGTELGPTDYDMYDDGGTPELSNLIRVDISKEQLQRHSALHQIQGHVDVVLPIILDALGDCACNNKGAARASNARRGAWEDIGGSMRSQVALLDAIRDTVPNSVFVGDSAQPIYGGNLYYDHDRPGGWFNAATGYGALGYAIPAAIGASLAEPSASIICITGDGGAQFTLPELMVAIDENLPILFLIYNNNGYREIETSMESAGVTVVGCDPTPPNFELIAAACRIPYSACDDDPTSLSEALIQSKPRNGPVMLEIKAS